MITLKDYIGTIVSSVNNARGMADVESAKLAKQYAEDEVLQFYTVPRMRMQDVELEIPVGIDSFNTKTDADYQPIDNNDFYSKTYTAIKDAFEIDRFNRKSSTKLSTFIKDEIQQLEYQLKKDGTAEEHVLKFSNKVAEQSIDIAKKEIETQRTKSIKNVERVKMPDFNEVSNLLSNRLAGEIKPRIQSKKIEDANVIVESDKLSTIAPDKLIKIKMKIIETGMEWHQMEDANGDVKSKLVSE
ncbi:MAG: hypothetical protein ACPGUH_04440 [Winogradskyella sp.]